jgi:hypothetical protein
VLGNIILPAAGSYDIVYVGLIISGVFLMMRKTPLALVVVFAMTLNPLELSWRTKLALADEPPVLAAKIIYVDASAVGANNGSDWEDAYNYLQDALADANEALPREIDGNGFISQGKKSVEIWVAHGVYTPDRTSAIPDGTSDRDAVFHLISGVTLRGGYAGLGQPDPNLCDYQLFKTILSGDLYGDDGPNLTKRFENSYFVVTGSGTDETAVLDGFTITGGNDDLWSRGYGGGMYNRFGSPTLVNCTFEGNFADRYGGGMNNVQSSPTLINCTFSENWLNGMYNDNSFPVLTDCNFIRNFDCGMENWESSPILTRCNFIGNLDSGMDNFFNSNAVLTDCSFIDNLCEISGGGMYNIDSSPILTNCSFIGNSAGRDGGGINNWNSSPIIANCVFSGNWAFWDGGGMNNWEGSLILTNCIFSGNRAYWGSGGGINNSGQRYNINQNRLTLINCTLAQNSATAGSALACGIYEQSGILELNNCIFWNGGNEIWNSRGSTITINFSDIQNGRPGIYDPCDMMIWGNGNLDANPCFVNLGYWDSNGTMGYEEDDFWVDGDYHLQSQTGRFDPNTKTWTTDDLTSPCIDGGNPDSDWTSELWPHGKRINLGAYGGTSQAGMSLSDVGDIRDLDNDDLVTWDDVLLLAGVWGALETPMRQDINRDGMVNDYDLDFFAGNWSGDSINVVPVFNPVAAQYAAAGDSLTFSVLAADSDGDELMYMVLGLPDGAEFSEQIFSWTPQSRDTGSHQVTFVVSDNKSLAWINVSIVIESNQPGE